MIRREYVYKYRLAPILFAIFGWSVGAALAGYIAITDLPTMSKHDSSQSLQAKWLFVGVAVLFLGFAIRAIVRLVHSLTLSRRIIIVPEGVIVPSAHWSAEETSILWLKITKLDADGRSVVKIEHEGIQHMIHICMLGTDAEFREIATAIEKSVKIGRYLNVPRQDRVCDKENDQAGP